MSPILGKITRFLRRSVTENLGLKLIAALVAILLVAFVRLQAKVERWVDVEVNVRRPAPITGVVLTTEPPDTVRVTLRGRESVIESVKKNPIPPVEMDVSTRTELGSFTHYFEPEDFNFKSGVDVVGINPDSVLMTVERLVTRRVPIRVKTSGRLDAGRILDGGPVADPGEIMVSGPSSVVRNLLSLDTNLVDIEGLDVGEHDFQVPLQRIDGLTVSRDQIDVKVIVKWSMGQRMLSGLLVQQDGQDRVGVEIRPAEVAVSLVGPQVALDKLDPSLVGAIVDMADDEPDKDGVLRLKVRVTGLPPDVKVKSIVPEIVLVKILLDEGARPRKAPASRD